jgi:hypothetical protein
MAMRPPIAAQNAQEADLAWALIEVTKPHMNAGERNFVFVAVGAGDTFAAIRCLINLVAAKRIPLRPHLMQQCRTWLDAYTFHDAYEQLRRVIEDFLMPTSIAASAAMRRMSPPRKSLPLLAVTGN